MFADPSLLIFVIIFFEYISRKLFVEAKSWGQKLCAVVKTFDLCYQIAFHGTSLVVQWLRL